MRAANGAAGAVPVALDRARDLAVPALREAAGRVLFEVPGERGAAAARHLGGATELLILGQAQDLDFEERMDVTVEECLAMTGNKTGALLACSASIGAVLAGAPPA